MKNTMEQHVLEALSSIERQGLTRFLHALPAVGGRLEWKGRDIVNFSSNDYLNLAGDARLKQAAQAAIEKFGCGATASRLMAGHLTLHEKLEARLADLVGEEAALAFPSGYQANLGVMTTLAGEGDAIFSDELNHASIVDGCRLSRADIHVYRHADMAQLDELLYTVQTRGRKIIVSDSVFSMDGDIAPVETLADLAKRYHALYIVDEAHAIGIFGGGSGICKELGVHPDVIVGTMSKSLGGGGGFAAGSKSFYTLLLNKARSFIYSTGLAPGCLGSAIEAVDIIQHHTGMGDALLNKAADFRHILAEKGFDVPGGPSQIIPIVIGDNQAAVDISLMLLERGFLITAVRPPTVPDGTARLRLSVTLAHSHDDFQRAAEILAESGVQAGVL